MTTPTGPIPFPSQPVRQNGLTVRPIATPRANPYAGGVNKGGASTPAARSVDVVDTVHISSAGPQGVDALVAGKVARPVDFEPAAQAPSASTNTGMSANPASVRADVVSLYQRSADLNAAATGVTLGRRLDVTG